jgi:superfamily II DNA/RNA helicase
VPISDWKVADGFLIFGLFRCGEEEKDAYLYYILSVHGHGRTMVFCTSIAALRHTSAMLHVLGINSWTLHAQMQQRARLKVILHFIPKVPMAKGPTFIAFSLSI